MKYPDGKKIIVGDKLILWEGCYGVVVGDIEAGNYNPEYQESDWAYLKIGILINSDKGGLIHYTSPENSFKLLERNHKVSHN